MENKNELEVREKVAKLATDRIKYTQGIREFLIDQDCVLNIGDSNSFTMRKILEKDANYSYVVYRRDNFSFHYDGTLQGYPNLVELISDLRYKLEEYYRALATGDPEVLKENDITIFRVSKKLLKELGLY